MRKMLPSLGEVADNVRVKDEARIQERDALIVVAQGIWNKPIESSLREEMKLIQPSCAPPFPSA